MNKEGPDQAIRDVVVLSRDLCESEWLVEQHTACKSTLTSILLFTDVREKLKLNRLSLWTICSRQKSSTVMISENCGHIIMDGYQLLALSSMLSAIALVNGGEAFKAAFLGLMGEEYLNCRRFELAYRCKRLSLESRKNHADAFVVTRDVREVYLQHEVQRIFVIGHELGHLMLLNRSTNLHWSELEANFQFRFEALVKDLREAPEEAKRTIDLGLTNLRDSTSRFRDELICDTIAIEIVGHALSRGVGGDKRRLLGCEAILVAAISLDFLRSIRLAATDADRSMMERVFGTFFDHNYLRTIYLTSVLRDRFSVTLDMLKNQFDRLNSTISSRHGLAFLFIMVEKLEKLSIPNGPDWNSKEVMIQVEELFGWRPDREALVYEQVF